MDVGSYYFSGGWVPIEGIVGKMILLDTFYHLKRILGCEGENEGFWLFWV